MQELTHPDNWALLVLMAGLFSIVGIVFTECAFSHPKNYISILEKHLIAAGTTFVVFWAIGYGLATGQTYQGLLGLSGFFPNLNGLSDTHFLNHFLVLSITALFVSALTVGALGKQLSTHHILCISGLMASLIFPTVAHWVWDTSVDRAGWLYRKGFVDAAGISTIHYLVGWIALTVIMLTSNIQRAQQKTEQEGMVSASNPMYLMVGTFLTWLGLLAIHSISNDALDEGQMLHCGINIIAGSMAAATTTFIMCLMMRHTTHVLLGLRALLAGMIAVATVAHHISFWGAIAVGMVAATSMLAGLNIIKRHAIHDRFHILSTHFFPSIWGILVGIGFNTLPHISTSAAIWVQLQGLFSIAIIGLLAGGIIFIILYKMHHTAKKTAKAAADTSPLPYTDDYPLSDEEETNSQPHVTALTGESSQLAEKLLHREGEITRLEKQLEQMEEQIETTKKSQTMFLASMSHEIRTPMHGIIGLSSLLEESELNKEQHEFTHSIHLSAQSLLSVINDILDFSKIESDALTLEHISFDLDTIIKNTIDTLNVLAEEKGLTLNAQYQSDIKQIIGDPTRLRQILLNIAGNSIKFTEQGSITISISSVANGDYAEIALIIEDTGVGIAEEKIDEIFNAFSQEDETVARKFGGTGLGLSITKRLVEMMGGKIAVESTVGEGTKFVIAIPFLIAKEKEEETSNNHEQSMEAIKKLNVLLVDDHKVNRMFASKLLKNLECKNVDMAEHGLEAMQKALECEYDVIFMDCYMPNMNGFEATMLIRDDELCTDHKALIIAMTADIMPGIVKRCLDSGMDGYISKPFNKDQLLKIIERYVLDKDKPQAPTISAAPEVHDDTPLDREYFQDITGGDRQLAQEAIESFLSQTEQDIATLELNTRDEQSKRWKEAAHRIKGAASYIGAYPLADICKKAEKSYEEASSMEKVAMVELIQERYTQFVQFTEENGY